MRRVLSATVVASAVASAIVSAQKVNERVDKTIEIRREGGKLAFVERGKDKATPVTIVVGQKIRWENKDKQPHTLVSVLVVNGKPLFDTAVIEPGAHKDLLFDFDLYRQAGGKPANVVTVKYKSRGQPGEAGELQFLSAARR